MKRIVIILLSVTLSAPLFAQKTQPVVDKETIKKVQQELKEKLPGAKIKTIKYDDGGVYVGEVNKKAKQGFGTMFFASGKVYIGEWESDINVGEGSMIYPDGDVYTGTWNGDNVSGQGTIKYADGGVYSGILENCVKHGEGTMQYANGENYQGGWDNDQRSGSGTMHYRNGDVYVGQWKEDMKTGTGKLTLSSTQSQDGTWEEDSFIDGTWVLDSTHQLKGHWGDSGFEGEACISNGEYTYTGTCLIPGNSSMLRYDLWNNCKYIDGTLKWSKGFISGEWADSNIIHNGSVEIEESGASIKGKVVDGSFEGEFKNGNESYNGAFTEDGTFIGEYTIQVPGQDYVFNGLMKKGVPIDGTIKHGSYEAPFRGEYVSDKEVKIILETYNGDEIPVRSLYSDNVHLFSKVETRISLPKVLSQQKVFDSCLKEQMFRQSFEDYPMGGVKQYVFWTFYADGVALKTWQNERFYHKASEKSKKNTNTTCPACNGSGKVTEHGYTVDGHPYSKIVKCVICNGTGKVKEDNVFAQASNEIWATIAANPTYVNSEGRDSYDVSKDSGFELFTYSIEGNTIILSETGQRFKAPDYYSIISENGKVEYNSIQSGTKYYESTRTRLEEYNPYTTFKKYSGKIVKNKYLPCTFFGGSTASFGNELTYKATRKQNIAIKNGILLSHEFSNGIGKIITDHNIIKYKEEEKSSYNSFSYGTSSAMSGLGGGGGSSRKEGVYETGCTVVFKIDSDTKGTLQSVNPPHTIER